MNVPSNQDTIAAIATAAGESAIAIVRLSGPESFTIADRIFACRAPKPSQRPPRTFIFGHVMDHDSLGANGNPRRIDEALLLLFQAPHSFTCQDVVEFQCHGGMMSAQRIYRTLLAQGARPAEPGEFTRRAFLNGRIDLIKAEAVIDMINAQTQRAATVAAEQLDGCLSQAMEELYDNIMLVLAEIEARLDFPEDDMPPLEEEHWRPVLSRTIETLEKLLATWDQGRRVRHGAVVVIAGCVNAGKSTLLNSLLGRERAIVSAQPGTTRDSIEEGFVLNGIPIRLMDTAGYRQTGCGIEKEGMARSDHLRRTADALLYVIDASEPLRERDRRNLAEAPLDRTALVFTKIDLGIRIEQTDYPELPAVFTNLTAPAERAESVKNLLAGILACGAENLEGTPLIAERHRNLLQRSLLCIREAACLLELDEGSHVPATIVLRDALSCLDECLGKTFSDTLLDTVFSKFCIGK